MTDTPVTLEVSRTRHHQLCIEQEPGLGPVRFSDLTLEQARILRELVNDASPCYEVQEVQVTAAPAAGGRHRRRVLGSGAATVPPVPDYSPSFADTHPRAAHELGQLIADLTEGSHDSGQEPVMFQVDLAYLCRDGEHGWGESTTHQATVSAVDGEKALAVAGRQLLQKLRRIGRVQHVDDLKIVGGTTNALG